MSVSRSLRLVGLLLTWSLIVITPWICGGVLGWWQTVLFGGLALSILCLLLADVCERDAPRISWLWLPALLGIAWGLAQCLPLPPGILQSISPEAYRIWMQAAVTPPEQDTWRPLSLYPFATWNVLAQVALAVSAGIVLAEARRFPRLSSLGLQLFACNGAALAAFGILQKLTWNGRLFWFVELTQGGTPFASFVNRNHAAGYLNLALGAALGCWFAEWYRSREKSADLMGFRSDWRTNVFGRKAARWGVVAGLITMGLIATLSRGGVLSFLVAGLVLVLGVGAAQSGLRPRLLVSLLVGLLLGWASTVVLNDKQSLTDRFEQMWEDNIQTEHGRWSHWHDAWKAAQDFWRSGSGLGTYRFIYRPYEARYFPATYFHAENQYLESAVELGFIGPTLIVWQIAAALWLASAPFRLGLRDLRWEGVRRVDDWDLYSSWSAAGPAALSMAALWGIVSTAAHSVSDFGLYLPSLSLGLSGLLGAALGQSHPRDTTQMDTPNQGNARNALGWGIAIGLLVILMLQTRVAAIEVLSARLLSELALASVGPPRATSPSSSAHWEQKLARLSAWQRQQPSDPILAAQLARMYGASYRRELHTELVRELPGVSVEWLWNSTDLETLHARLHQLLQTGNAVEVSKIRSRPEVRRWLKPARDLLQQSLTASPLHPSAFLRLACLCPVFEDQIQAEQQYIRAAVDRAPHHPRYLFRAGRLCLQSGYQTEALEFWKRALSQSPVYAREILILGRNFLPLDRLLDAVLPESPLRILEIAEQYLTEDSLTELRLTLAHAAEERLAHISLERAERLYAQGVIRQIRGKEQEAIEFLAQAIALEPHRAAWRYRQAKLLWGLGRLSEAEQQALACVGIEPNSQRYQRLLANIRAGASAKGN